jgi:DNA-binding HxlR family transcriptional regulator
MNTTPLLPSSPIARALAVVGDRWSVLILREMFLGRSRFGELVEATGASRATLSKRLRTLVAKGLLRKHPYQQRPLRVEYRLTAKGAALYDFALAAWLWEYRFARRDDRGVPARLQHRPCASRFLPVPACTRCGGEIRLGELRYREGRGRGNATLNAGARRRSSAPARGDEAGMMLHFVDVVADPWTPLVLAAAFMGRRRFDDIRREIGIATNILSNRLRQLVEAGVLRQQPGEETVRLEYVLTAKGAALVVAAVALHQWALAWLPGGKVPSLELMHACSPRPLSMRMECSHCHQPLQARDVAF